MDGICTACDKPCREIYQQVDSVSYTFRDRNVTDKIFSYSSDCCNADVRRFNEDGDEER